MFQRELPKMCPKMNVGEKQAEKLRNHMKDETFANGVGCSSGW